MILNSCGEFIRSGVTHDGISVEESDWRTCYEYTFIDNVELQNLILSKLQNYNVKSVPTSMTVVRYDAGQYFKNHIDSGIGHEDRVKTISIQLSDKIFIFIKIPFRLLEKFVPISLIII